MLCKKVLPSFSAFGIHVTKFHKRNTDCYRCDLVAGTKMKVNKHSQQHSLFAKKRAINSDIVFFLSVESLLPSNREDFGSCDSVQIANIPSNGDKRCAALVRI